MKLLSLLKIHRCVHQICNQVRAETLPKFYILPQKYVYNLPKHGGVEIYLMLYVHRVAINCGHIFMADPQKRDIGDIFKPFKMFFFFSKLQIVSWSLHICIQVKT